MSDERDTVRQPYGSRVTSWDTMGRAVLQVPLEKSLMKFIREESERREVSLGEVARDLMKLGRMGYNEVFLK